MGNWLNKDGLYIKFGPEQAVPNKTGGYADPADGTQSVLELDIDLTAVGSSPAIVSDVHWLPAYARIEKVEVTVLEVADGANATLNMGLQKKDRATEIDYNGILADVPETDLDAAEGTVYSWTTSTSGGAGNLVGATAGVGPDPGYITVDYDTAAFTAGRIKVKLFYTLAANRPV
jgi:hypothetical protein